MVKKNIEENKNDQNKSAIPKRIMLYFLNYGFYNIDIND